MWYVLAHFKLHIDLSWNVPLTDAKPQYKIWLKQAGVELSQVLLYLTNINLEGD